MVGLIPKSCSAFFAFTHGTKIEEFDVIIMGAGMTGISAGHILANASNVNFIIIEAQDYIGGRTHTIPFGSNNIPLNKGASWVSATCIYPNPHDSCNFESHQPSATNPMQTFALKYGINMTNTRQNDLSVHPPFLNGHSIIPSLFINLEYAQWEMVQKCLKPIIEAINLGVIDDISYGQGLQDCLWKKSWSGYSKNLKNTIQWMQFDFEFACNVWEGSLGQSTLTSYINYGNQDWFITDYRGYQGITLELAADYLNLDDLENEPKIALNSPINHIEYDKEGGVTVYIADSDRVYHAKYGIITFSIGALQSDLVTYSPPWPQWKYDAVYGMMMSHYTPIYVEWPYDFWSLIHPEINDNKIVIMVNERYGYFPWFLNLNHDDLLKGSLIWRFDVTGDLSLRIQNQDIEQTKYEIWEVMTQQISVPEIVPEPLNVFVADWSLNEFIRGSYSSAPVGKAGKNWETELEGLRQPLGEVLFFGGEAMQGDDNGFVHSAYLDGIRVGKTMLNCLGLPDVEQYPCRGPFSLEKR